MVLRYFNMESLSENEIQKYMNCPPTGIEEGLIGYWNFEEGQGDTVYDLTGNGNDGIINGATYSTDVPEQSCQLTTVNGCDSVAVLNLTITQPDTSFTEVSACESYEWNDSTYSQSGTYTYDVVVENNYSNNFSAGDNIIIPNSLELNPTELTISFWVKLNSNSNYNHFVNKWDGDTHQFIISSNNTGIYAYRKRPYKRTTK